MKFHRIAIVKSKKNNATSDSLCKCLIKSLKRRGFLSNQIFVFKVFDTEDLPRAVQTLARVEKPAPFTSIIAIGFLVKSISQSNISAPDFLKSSIMKIGLDFDVHVKSIILIVDSIPIKKSYWSKLVTSTTRSIQTSNELIKNLEVLMICNKPTSCYSTHKS